MSGLSRVTKLRRALKHIHDGKMPEDFQFNLGRVVDELREIENILKREQNQVQPTSRSFLVGLARGRAER